MGALFNSGQMLMLYKADPRKGRICVSVFFFYYCYTDKYGYMQLVFAVIPKTLFYQYIFQIFLVF